MDSTKVDDCTSGNVTPASVLSMEDKLGILRKFIRERIDRCTTVIKTAQDNLDELNHDPVTNRIKIRQNHNTELLYLGELTGQIMFRDQFEELFGK